MRQRHAMSLGVSGHYQDIGISSFKLHNSACVFKYDYKIKSLNMRWHIYNER